MVTNLSSLSNIRAAVCFQMCLKGYVSVWAAPGCSWWPAGTPPDSHRHTGPSPRSPPDSPLHTHVSTIIHMDAHVTVWSPLLVSLHDAIVSHFNCLTFTSPHLSPCCSDWSLIRKHCCSLNLCFRSKSWFSLNVPGTNWKVKYLKTKLKTSELLFSCFHVE